MVGTVRRRALAGVVAVATAATTVALSPGTDVFVPAAARGPGATGTWVTDLHLHNPGGAGVTARLYWLRRERDNTGAVPVEIPVPAGATVTLEDVILTTFGLPSAAGAIRVLADLPLAVSARIYNVGGGSGTFGQGFEGVPAPAALGPGERTAIAGLVHDHRFVTNLFAVNTAATTTELRLELRDPSGAVLAHRTYTLNPLAALYREISDLGAGQFGRGDVVAEVVRGSAIVVASTIDVTSGDPTTQEAAWPAPPPRRGDYLGTAFDGEGVIAGAIWVRLDDEGRLTEAVWWVGGDPGCVVVGGGGVVDPPATFDDLGAGLVRTEDWSASDPSLGRLTWTLTLAWAEPRLHLTGSLAVVGEGWEGSPYPCLEGDHPAVRIELGRTGAAP